MAERKLIQPTPEEIAYDPTDPLFWAKAPIMKDRWLQVIAPQILPKSKVYPLRIGYALETFLEDDSNIFGIISKSFLEEGITVFTGEKGAAAKQRFIIRSDWELSFRLPKDAKDILRGLREYIEPQDWTKIGPMILSSTRFDKAIGDMKTLLKNDKKVKSSIDLYDQLDLLLEEYWSQFHNINISP